MVNRDFHPPPAGLGGPAGGFIIVVNNLYPPASAPRGLGKITQPSREVLPSAGQERAYV